MRAVGRAVVENRAAGAVRNARRGERLVEILLVGDGYLDAQRAVRAVDDVQHAVLAGCRREVQSAGCVECSHDGGVEVLVVGAAELMPPLDGARFAVERNE